MKSNPLIARRVAFAAGALVLSAVGAIAVGEATGWSLLRGPIAQRLAAATGVPVRIEGVFRLQLLLRPSARIGHLVIGAGAGVAVPHLVDATALELEWRWRDLWRARAGEPLRLQRLVADTLDAHLVRLADGRASWQLGAAPASTTARPTTLPRFGWLQVQRGRAQVDDAVTDTRLVVQVQGGEGDAAAGRSGYRASANGRWRALPLKLELTAGAALPLAQDAEAAAAAPMVPLRVEGSAGAATVLFDGRVGALFGERRLDGDIRLSGPSLAPVGAPLGVTLPQTPPFELAGHLNHGDGVWHLRAERAVIGRSRLNGDFRFDTRPQPARLTGRLGGTRLLLADLGPAVGKDPAGTKPAPGGRVLPQRRFDLPSLRGMDADVQTAIDEFDFGSTAIAPLRQLRAHVLLADGVLRLNELSAQVAGGHVSGSTSLDARNDPARWTADLRFDGVDIAGALPALRTAPRPGQVGPKSYITGQAAGRLQASGRGRSTAEILATLDGTLQAAVRNGTISHLVTEAAGIDIAQALGVLVRGDDALPMRCARVDLQLQQGVVRPRTAVVDNRDSTLRVAGQVDLRDETLALQARVRPKDFSPLSLRAPVTLTGTLGQPVVGVDSGKLAARLAGSVVLGVLAAPLAALLPFVDTGDREPGDPCVDAKPGQKVER